jgi:phage host-nuclease inhibitor protein Gam
MKNALLIASFAAAISLTACKPSTTTTASNQLDKAEAATKDVAQHVQDYTFEQRTAFVTTMQAQLADLTRTVDEVSAKVEKSSDAVQAEAKPKIAALREQVAQLTKQLGTIADATPSTWDSIKADAQKAYANLKDGVTQSRQWLSDKIAP